MAVGDQDSPGESAAQEAQLPPMCLEVVKRPEANHDWRRQPTRGVGERSNVWAARWRRLARDDAQWAEPLAADIV